MTSLASQTADDGPEDGNMGGMEDFVKMVAMHNSSTLVADAYAIRGLSRVPNGRLLKIKN